MRDEIITVVGGSGFLGRYVVKHLAKAGYRVRVCCRKPHLAEHVKPSGQVGQITLEYLDLAKPETITPALNGSYGVINLVGLLFESGSQKFIQIHAQGAEKLAQEAASQNAEAFVQVSALGIERAQHSTYARTKREGEKAVLAAFPKATIIRPSVIFGPEDNFFNFFAKIGRFSPIYPAFGGGKTQMQPVYVDDVAKAIVKTLDMPEAEGKTYELGGPTIYTFKELMEYIDEVTGRNHCKLSLPFTVGKLMGGIMQHLPSPMLTADQVKLLESDNVVSDQALTFADLGISPASVEAVVPHYLDHHRRHAA